MSTIARTLAGFVLETGSNRFPALARSRAVDAITDCIGCMLAGATEPLAGSLRRGLRAGSAGGVAVLAGDPRGLAPCDAALANGALAHALDYDDTNHPAYAHPSAVLVPALLSAAAIAPLTGRAFVNAYVIGFEVFGKLGRAMNTAHYRRGWHATATFGTLAAAASVAHALRLDADQTVAALGIAASAAGGLRANFGSMVKPLHAGYAARNGLLAALLAREGHDASERALEHDYGYLQLFSGDGGFDARPLSSWGEPLEILTPYGLALKPYPSCGATHTGIEAALQLRDLIGGERPQRIEAGVSELAFAPLIHVRPRVGLEGKFSLHYCLAVAFLEGEITLASFRQGLVDDPRVSELIERTTMFADPSVGDGAEFPTRLRVHMADGREHQCFVPLAQGKPARWFSPERIRAKFDDCLRSYDPVRASALFAGLRALDEDRELQGPDSLLARLADCALPELPPPSDATQGSAPCIDA
jgi:2-methylcitrate dehydratase PrpD